MPYAYGGGSLNDRKQALIKKLAGRNSGSGGAARLSGGVPFGALPRLGVAPRAGVEADISGIGPSAGAGSGSIGIPQPPGQSYAGPTTGGGFSGGGDPAPVHPGIIQSILPSRDDPQFGAYSAATRAINGSQPGAVNVEFLRSLGFDQSVIDRMLGLFGGNDSPGYGVAPGGGAGTKQFMAV